MPRGQYGNEQPLGGGYGAPLVGADHGRRSSSASHWILGGLVVVGAVVVWNHESKKTAKLYKSMGKRPSTLGEDTKALVEDVGTKVKHVAGEAREKFRDWRSRKG